MGNLQHVRLKAIGMDMFQSRGNLSVDTLSPRCAGLVIKHVPDQRMGELERLPLASKQVLAHPFFQQVQQRLLIHATHRAQNIETKTITQEGRQRQDAPTAFTEPLDATDNGARNLAGKREVSRHRARDQVPTTFLDRLLLYEVMEYLLDK
jgi:hypothetical protein